jgi:hypothetical protein
MIIGVPKTIDEIPVLPVSAFEELASQLNPQLAQGHPLEIPIAMPFGMLCQVASTLKAYHAILAKMQEEEADFEALREEAAALLATEPPPVPKVQPAKGTIILPK